MVGGQVNPTKSTIIDNNNNDNNNNNNNIPLNSFQLHLNFSNGGGRKCSHRLRPSSFKVFVGTLSMRTTLKVRKAKVCT